MPNMRDDHAQDDGKGSVVNQVPAPTEATIPPVGGGGGSLGATMESRLAEPLREMGPADAADTGGIAIDPTAIMPGPASRMAGDIDADPESAAIIDLSDPSIPDAGPAHDMG